MESAIFDTVSSIAPLDEKAVLEAKKYQATLAIPPGSLGELLEIGSRLSGITGRLHNSLPKKRIIVLASDNGIAEEGVSSAPQSVTSSQAVNMTKYLTGMSALAKHFCNEVQVVDVGIKCDYDCPEILNKKIRRGTTSFLKGPAMSREEAISAIKIGLELAEIAKKDGVSVVGVGEMGIGNTTTSTAVLSVLSGIDSDKITGRGGGVTDAMLAHKKEVIKKGIEINRPDKNDVIDVLSKVGGFDLAAMCGVFLGCAKNRLPVVIDGYISAVAALCARRLSTVSAQFFFPSHCSEESGYKIAVSELGLNPYLNLGMRLGEGSGCPLAFEIMEGACTIMNEMATFSQAKINDSYLDEIRKGKAVQAQPSPRLAQNSSHEFCSLRGRSLSPSSRILITGGCKNGKSSLAQEIACSLTKSETTKQSNLVYFATMIPHDDEDEARIKKHREERKNLGFETIECGKNILTFAEKIEGKVVLFDSLTALVQNEIFDSDFTPEVLGPALSEPSVIPSWFLSVVEGVAKNISLEEKITKKIRGDLEIFIEKAESVIFVSDTIFSDGKIYDKITELYRRILAQTENFVASKCDKVVEMATGISNDQLEISNVQSGVRSERGEKTSSLILGGAYQGKTAFAKKHFLLSDDEIFVCPDDSLPDFSKKCLAHYENYVAYCIKNNLSPKTEFGVEKGENVRIIICDDIFCGVVPIDPFQRKLRETTGLALQKIAEKSEVYRVFCGIGQKIQ